MSKFIKKKITSAFTMLELVMVIVLIGIISVMIAPSFETNNTIRAAEQLLSNIRYTQHLAMMDNKFEPSNQYYYRNRWNIDINSTSYAITHYNYKNDGSNSGTTYATNTLDTTKKLNPTETKELDVSEEYGVSITNNCSNNKIFFDNMGRPYDDTTNPSTSSYQNLITNICTIVISDGNAANDKTIELMPETGYVRLKP
ncbi:Tfp pilus assembly protein FimT/FimU [Sulfurospirillum sp. 1307]